MKYRRRSNPTVDAIQWLGDNQLDVAKFLGVGFRALKFTKNDALIVGMDEAAVGEWVIKKGHHLSVQSDDIFNALYEPVEPDVVADEVRNNMP